MVPKTNTYYIANDSGNYCRILYLTSVKKVKDEELFPKEYEIKGILLCGFDDEVANWWGTEVDSGQGDIQDLETGYGEIYSIKPHVIIKKLFKTVKNT